MTQPQSDTLTPYAPLPVRARGTLEIFDTAFKLFRRYAGVLLAWSALSSLVNLIPILGWMTYIFTMPLMFGAVSCVVAGAVRGQKVSFKQIWGFTKPRYGALLGVLIIAAILMGMVMVGLMIAGSLLVVLFVNFATNYGIFVTVVAWIVGTLGGLIGSSFLLAVMMGWFNLAPVIACLEDANRGSNALTRAWVLLKGNWRKACGVATILALAGTAAMLIVIGFSTFFFSGGWDKFLGADVSFLSGLAVSGVSTLFFVVWTPLQAVVGAVFYLDLRTRKEALDLEWTNYAAKPETLTDRSQSAPAFSPSPPPPTMGNPPYAPASSLQAPSSPPNFPPPPPPQPSPFAAQPSVQAQLVEVVVAPAPTPIPSTADSFAAFASQLETAPPTPASPPTVALNLEATPPSTEASIFTPAVIVQPEPTPTLEVAPIAVEPTPIGSAPPVAPLEPVPAPTNDAPTFGNAPIPVTPPVNEPAPVSLAPEPSNVPVAPPVPAPQPDPAPAETSSFAPRRFRRAASEDDDYPSSFGGGPR